MIEIMRKADCCGCGACAAVCPKFCIKMIPDSQGFLYPGIKQVNCIECHKCEKVCPVLNANCEPRESVKNSEKEYFTKSVVADSETLPDCNIAYIKDKKARDDSTSGGIFSLIANYVLSKNGVVFGAEVDEHMVIRHIKIDNSTQLGKLRGAKYVQSEQSGVFKDVQEELKAGKTVLYTGTPCQADGLHRYLDKEYVNLILIDIFCHGVGAPEYWKKYCDYMKAKHKSQIERVKFREKTYGYNSACMAVYFENGRSSHKGHEDDIFWKAFSKCYIFRPSCYECRFKNINHCSDITIGDYWDTSGHDVRFLKANGCSLVLTHSGKGKKILYQLADKVEIDAEDIYKALIVNGGHQASMLIASSAKPGYQESFMNDIPTMGIEKLVQKYIPIKTTVQIKCLIKPLLYKIGILEIAKKIKRGMNNA